MKNALSTCNHTDSPETGFEEIGPASPPGVYRSAQLRPDDGATRKLDKGGHDGGKRPAR
jgi:hypothetical protein